MKGRYNKILLPLIGILVLILSARADALIWINGDSDPGNIAFKTAVLLPLPLINLSITESEVTDLLGSLQLTITEHDDENKYNLLQIDTGSEELIELPIPYGSMGLSYLTLSGLPPSGKDQSELYFYLSVAYGRVVSNVKSDIDLSLNVDRDKLIAILTPILPEINLDEFIAEGPFEIEFSLSADFSEKATLADPTIEGEFTCVLTLPEDIIVTEIPLEIPTGFSGSLSIEALFDWAFFSPFTAVNLSLTLTSEEDVKTLDPIQFNFIPNGTLILWLDREV